MYVMQAKLLSVHCINNRNMDVLINGLDWINNIIEISSCCLTNTHVTHWIIKTMINKSFVDLQISCYIRPFNN